MTDTVEFDTPEYAAQHEQIDEMATLATLEQLLAEANEVLIDFEVPEPLPEDAYPTVAQIEADLDAEVDEEPEEVKE
jgi:hypothetical protein